MLTAIVAELIDGLAAQAEALLGPEETGAGLFVLMEAYVELQGLLQDIADKLVDRAREQGTVRRDRTRPVAPVPGSPL